MSITDDLLEEVKQVFLTRWEFRNGETIPEAEDIALGNDAVKIKGTVLYADLADSTDMVNKKTSTFSAEVYKAYLITACRIIKDEGGVITAFDGDRVMAVYFKDNQNTSATRSALKINWAVKNIVNPSLLTQYPTSGFTIRQSVGIDTSELLVAKTGIRGSNDLVWVGRSANYAAKLCSLRSEPFVTWITEDVYNSIHESVKITNDQQMWEKRLWTAQNNYPIYRSSWLWRL
jgi:class 3 adenylate cyclase